VEPIAGVDCFRWRGLRWIRLFRVADRRRGGGWGPEQGRQLARLPGSCVRVHRNATLDQWRDQRGGVRRLFLRCARILDGDLRIEPGACHAHLDRTDFTGNSAPTSLDGVQVAIAGQPAFVEYISPGQLDAQLPSNIGTGSLPLHGHQRGSHQRAGERHGERYPGGLARSARVQHRR